MPFGLHEDRRRRRRRRNWLLVRWAAAMALIGAAGFYSYETGRRLAAADIDRLEVEGASLAARLAASEALTEHERAAAAAAAAAARDWQARYERDVARGTARELVEAVQRKLAEGVEAERLKTVIAATGRRRDCRREGERRQFPVPVSDPAAARSALKFGRGLPSLTLVGTPAALPTGKAPAAFDPGRPVTARLVRGGGQTAETAGTLPLALAMIVGEREYVFRIVPAKGRGEVDIFADSCRFP